MNNSCSLIRDLFPLYEECEISPETKRDIKEHLDDCPQCREYYREFTRKARSMKSPSRNNRYQYSALADRIKASQRQAALLAAAACFAFLAVGYMIGSAERDR